MALPNNISISSKTPVPLYFRRETKVVRKGFLWLQKKEVPVLVLYCKDKDGVEHKVDQIGQGIRIIENESQGRTKGLNFLERLIGKDKSTSSLEVAEFQNVEHLFKTYHLSTRSLNHFKKRMQAIVQKAIKNNAELAPDLAETLADTRSFSNLDQIQDKESYTARTQYNTEVFHAVAQNALKATYFDQNMTAATKKMSKLNINLIEKSTKLGNHKDKLIKKVKSLAYRWIPASLEQNPLQGHLNRPKVNSFPLKTEEISEPFKGLKLTERVYEGLAQYYSTPESVETEIMGETIDDPIFDDVSNANMFLMDEELEAIVEIQGEVGKAQKAIEEATSQRKFEKILENRASQDKFFKSSPESVTHTSDIH